MEEKQLYTISIYSENNIGLLNRISAIFLKRHINIESFSTSPSEIKNVFRFVIVVQMTQTKIKKNRPEVPRAGPRANTKPQRSLNYLPRVTWGHLERLLGRPRVPWVVLDASRNAQLQPKSLFPESFERHFLHQIASLH